MHTKNNKNDISLREALEPITRVLKSLQGEFTFMDKDGDVFIISRKRSEAVVETQLSLENAAGVTEEFVSLSQEDQDVPFSDEDAAQYDEIGGGFEEHEASDSEEEYTPPPPPPVRVRFEPLRGDLPPELQQ